MLRKSARKGHNHRLGGLASRCNQNPWVSGMLLFGAFMLVTLFSFELVENLAYAQESASTAKTTVLDALIKAGFVGLIIILMSIVGGALSITFAFQLRRDIMVPPDVLAHVEQLFEDEEYEEAYHLCEATPSILSQVVAGGLSKIEDGYESMSDRMVEVIEMESTKLHMKVGYISLIANLSPMMGLLGTVYGMIVTFNKIANSKVQPSPTELADGISIALGSTFLGLCVAIPMSAIYVYFRNKVIQVVNEVGDVCDELMLRFKAE